jgi:hypothetical protein
MIEHQAVTSCIVHLADSANFKGITSIERCIGLTDSCFESPNDTIHVTVTAKCKRPKRTDNLLLKDKKEEKRNNE